MATFDKNFRVKNSAEAKSYIVYTTAGVTPSVGEIAWDIDNETMAVRLDEAVVLPIGQKHVIRVKNNSGSVAIPKFTFVMFAGATGDTVSVSPAVTDGTSPHEYMVGITAEEIPADGFGFVTQNGFINNVNTNSYTLGQLLYPDPAVAGGFTTTRPAAPAFDVAVAAVTKVNAVSGRVLVRMANGETLDSLHNVQITSATTGQVLKFNGTVWVNDTDATGGGGGGGLTVSETAPGSPTEGDLWFNSLTGRTYLYYDGYWIEWDTYQVGIVTATGATINTFNAIEISGQGTIVADSSADTLTLVAGANITITTNTASDSITIAASGGGGEALSPFLLMGA